MNLLFVMNQTELVLKMLAKSGVQVKPGLLVATHSSTEEERGCVYINNTTEDLLMPL